MAKFIRKIMNMENGVFQGVGYYNIPVIKGMQPDEFDKNAVFLQFHKAVTVKENRKRYSVHFFVDDYQFERCWTSLIKYTRLLSQFDYVLSPDFSYYLDMPKACQIYNHYRKHYLAAFWQAAGIKVIPTICWSDEESFNWCLDGEPRNSIVAVSTVGSQNEEWKKRYYIECFKEMKRRLNPSLIISYGHLPKELEGEDDIFVINPFYEDAKKRCTMQAKLKKAMKGVKK